MILFFISFRLQCSCNIFRILFLCFEKNRIDITLNHNFLKTSLVKRGPIYVFIYRQNCGSGILLLSRRNFIDTLLRFLVLFIYQYRIRIKLSICT